MKRISLRRGANPLCVSSGLVRSESTLFVVSGYIKAFEYEAKSTGRCYAGGGAKEGGEGRQNIAGVAEEGSSSSNSSSSSGGGGGGIVFHCTAFNCIPKWLCAKSSTPPPSTTLAILLQPGTDGEASSAP